MPERKHLDRLRLDAIVEMVVHMAEMQSPHVPEPRVGRHGSDPGLGGNELEGPWQSPRERREEQRVYSHPTMRRPRESREPLGW